MCERDEKGWEEKTTGCYLFVKLDDGGHKDLYVAW